MARKFFVGFALVTVAGLVAGTLFWKLSGEAAAENRKGGDAARVVPVQVAQAKTADLPVVLSGLGTVVPTNSVTVRARVDGQLVRVLFREGQLVEKGQLLAEIDARPFRVKVAQAEGQLARDRALLENARIELDRANVLVKESLVSGQQVSAQKSLVEQYEGTERIGQGLLSAAALELSFTRVTAPIRGRIGFRQLDAGNNVSTADGLAVIHTVEPISVVFSLSEDDVPTVLRELRKAEQAGRRLEVEAWEKSNRALLARGELLTIDNQIDVTTGTVKLKAEFKNEDGLLFPSQFVNVRFVVDIVRGATVVPVASIQRGRDGPFVYVVDGQNAVAVRKVTLGSTEGNELSIREGLLPGERVVLQGADQVREGTRVKPIERESSGGPRTEGGGRAPRAAAP